MSDYIPTPREVAAAKVRAFYKEGAGKLLDTSMGWVKLSRQNAERCSARGEKALADDWRKHADDSEKALKKVLTWIAPFGYDISSISQFLTYSRFCAHKFGDGPCAKCPEPPQTHAEAEAEAARRAACRPACRR